MYVEGNIYIQDVDHDKLDFRSGSSFPGAEVSSLPVILLTMAYSLYLTLGSY